MIKGTAKLEISQETMVLALQEYFDGRLASDVPLLVKSVDRAGPAYESSVRFMVELEEGVVDVSAGQEAVA